MNRKYLAIFCCFALVFTSCNQNKKTANNNLEKSLEVKVDTSEQVIKLDNSLFSVPSPYQLSMLIKETGASYNSEILNNSENFKQYANNFKKSVNLGVYGADLAYLNIYEQSASAITYFSIIKLLAQDLGLSAAFTPSTLKRIEKNIENQDSLLFIMSNTYSNVDFFLKENKRGKEGALILSGGWVEAMYILTKLATETKNEKLIQRVGENKQPLSNLIKVLQPYSTENREIIELINKLSELYYEFDAVETSYEFVEPETLPEQQLTKIHSKTKVVVSNEVLASIVTRVESIRNMIIN